MNLIKKILVAQAAVLFVWMGTAQANTDEAVAERLKPVGNVCIEGQECAAAEASAAAAQEAVAEDAGAAVADAEPAGRSGEDIVARSCGVCHATGLLEAPITGDTEAWAARAEAEGGLDGLLAISKSGKGAMPPMGTCADCSDAEMLSAIKVMSGL